MNIIKSLGLLALSLVSTGFGVASAHASRHVTFNGAYTGHDSISGEVCYVNMTLERAFLERPEALSVSVSKRSDYTDPLLPDLSASRLMPVDDAKGLKFEEGKGGEYSFTMSKWGRTTNIQIEWNDQQAVKVDQSWTGDDGDRHTSCEDLQRTGAGVDQPKPPQDRSGTRQIVFNGTYIGHTPTTAEVCVLDLRLQPASENGPEALFVYVAKRTDDFDPKRPTQIGRKDSPDLNFKEGKAGQYEFTDITDNVFTHDSTHAELEWNDKHIVKAELTWWGMFSYWRESCVGLQKE